MENQEKTMKIFADERHKSTKTRKKSWLRRKNTTINQLEFAVREPDSKNNNPMTCLVAADPLVCPFVLV